MRPIPSDDPDPVRINPGTRNSLISYSRTVMKRIEIWEKVAQSRRKPLGKPCLWSVRNIPVSTVEQVQ
jgi:hypothetical protein